MASKQHWQFWIDTGGTFTDCLALSPTGEEKRLKVLSTGAVRGRVEEIVDRHRIRLAGLPMAKPDFYRGYRIGSGREPGGVEVVGWDAATGMARVSSMEGWDAKPGQLVDLSAGEEAPVLAMRLLAGVSAGEPFPECAVRLATTRATNALLEGRAAECALFVTAGFGDLLRIGDQRREELFALNPSKPPALHGPVVEVDERLGADGGVLKPLTLDAVRRAAEALHQRGLQVAAVALMHSYRNPAHEQAVAACLYEVGFTHVSVSSELAPLIRIVPRAATAVVDGMLSPVMEDYLNDVGRMVSADRFQVMTSAGGLVRREAYRSKDSLLSGPAGGLVGAVAVAKRAGCRRMIGFDMGGTSTDVARFDGDYDYGFEHRVGPARVLAPALRVETVAAGGGSICRFDGSALVVGPGSAGADPGPACYGAGGPLTLTDVNLLAGHLSPDLFGVPVFVEAAEARLEEVLTAVRQAQGSAPAREAVLAGFLSIADERMADAIRRISVREGYDPAGYTLVAFGGAGGLHACAVAARLGMRDVLFPGDSGLLSAFGLREAVSERFAERQVLLPLDEMQSSLSSLVAELGADARALLVDDGVEPARVSLRRTELELRFRGQDSTLTISADPPLSAEERFGAAYRSRYGYVPAHRTVELVTVRVMASTAAPAHEPETFHETSETADTPAVCVRGQLTAGQRLTGPGTVQDTFSTLRIAPGWSGVVGSAGSIRLRQVDSALPAGSSQGLDVVDLELFTCRFTSLVEDMGMLLQRCASSVNVKERLDFSCGLMDAEGELVSNAPHIPVHLGALGMCVRAVRERLPMQPGDVVVTNHPGYGGSHLPDVTLVAPVHTPAGRLIGYVANRAHHAEIGGSRPGSMPPHARCLAEEGVVIPPTLIVRGGETCWDEVRARLTSGRWPTRALDENIADLHAQLAAVRQGTAALRELVDSEGIDRVHGFMRRLKERSAEALREALGVMQAKTYAATDVMDDGTPIAVRCQVEPGRLVVDFAGSGAVHPGNLNATPAIVHSALIYVLRLLARQALPLNEGLLRDVSVRIPSGLLSPAFPERLEECPAVVGGNVETSQRVVDVLLQAFGLAACSQGTMNNVTFGNRRFSCYETLGGGAGATPAGDGCSAVHVHMTNTAITDPEVMEVRMPVRLERFAVRARSGGDGLHRGGDGLERWIRFLEPVELSILAQRRVAGAPGAQGGATGSPGQQALMRRDGETQRLDGCAAVAVEAGELLMIRTPGGGGWGTAAG